MREIDEIIESSMSIHQKTKVLLKYLKDDIDSRDTEDNLRTKRNLENVYRCLFLEEVEKFEGIHEELQSCVKNKLFRETEIILCRKLNEEEKEGVLNRQINAETILTNKLMRPTHSHFKLVFDGMEERYRDIQKLEKNVILMHKLFEDMARLTKHQGELIDNIQLNISTAKKYVDDVKPIFDDTIVNIRAARKKKCCILITSLVVIIVILAPILKFTVF